MVTSKPTREVVRIFRDAGWTTLRTDGSHTRWACPTSTHKFTLPDGHRNISPGVVRKAEQALADCDCTKEATP